MSKSVSVKTYISIHRLLILGCALVGAFASRFLVFGLVPLTWLFQLGTFDLIAGATAGGLLGHLAWVLARPAERVSRAAAFCVAGNAVVWLLFLCVSPPLTTADFQEIDLERARRDGDTGLDLLDHQPIVVAARLHGTYGAANAADRLLGLTAGPAIDFADLLIVPARYFGSLATKRESFRIAALGFLLSTAFWTAFGDLVSAIRKRRKEDARS